MRVAIALLCTGCFAVDALAEPQVWLNPGIYALHFDRDKDLRDDIAPGVVAGAFDGYPNYRDGSWFVAPLALLAVEGRRLGVNLSVIPTIRDRLAWTARSQCS